jgi:hypothetical protein
MLQSNCGDSAAQDTGMLRRSFTSDELKRGGSGNIVSHAMIKAGWGNLDACP